MIAILGATGATGKLLVARLLERGQAVKVFVRSAERIPVEIRGHKLLHLIPQSVLDMYQATLAREINGCRAVASCLGHNLTWRGVYGPPYRLVADSVKRLCAAIKANTPAEPVKFVLMNTTACRNRDLKEPRSIAEQCAFGLIRLLLPPHPDNEQAAEFLRTQVGQDDPHIKWVAVRPDSLIDASKVTPYTVVPSPLRSPIFNSGKTSRINVAHFMAQLLTDQPTCDNWQGQMPVVYNSVT